MFSFLKLIRFQNLMMIVLIMILTKYTLLHAFGNYLLSHLHFIGLIITVLLISAAGYIINDIHDVATDSINRPHKLLVTKSISTRRAWAYYWALTIPAVLLSILWSTKPIHWFLFFGTPAVLWSYTVFFKKIPILGNIVIAILVTLPAFTVFIFDFIPASTGVWALDRPVYFTIIAYSIFAFLSTLIREIVKDIEDINGDYTQKMNTLPIILGIKRTRNIAIGLSLVLILSLVFVNQIVIMNPLAFGLGIYSYTFLVLPLLYFLYKLWNADIKKDFTFLSDLMKWIMLLGILSMVLYLNCKSC